MCQPVFAVPSHDLALPADRGPPGLALPVVLPARSPVLQAPALPFPLLGAGQAARGQAGREDAAPWVPAPQPSRELWGVCGAAHSAGAVTSACRLLHGLFTCARVSATPARPQQMVPRRLPFWPDHVAQLPHRISRLHSHGAPDQGWLREAGCRRPLASPTFPRSSQDRVHPGHGGTRPGGDSCARAGAAQVHHPHLL